MTISIDNRIEAGVLVSMSTSLVTTLFCRHRNGRGFQEMQRKKKMFLMLDNKGI